MALARATSYYYHCWRCGGAVMAYEGRLCGFFRRSCPVCWPTLVTDSDGYGHGGPLLDPHGPGPGQTRSDYESDEDATWTLRQWPRRAPTDDGDEDDYILISGSDEDCDDAAAVAVDEAAAQWGSVQVGGIAGLSPGG